MSITEAIPFFRLRAENAKMQDRVKIARVRQRSAFERAKSAMDEFILSIKENDDETAKLDKK